MFQSTPSPATAADQLPSTAAGQRSPSIVADHSPSASVEEDRRSLTSPSIGTNLPLGEQEKNISVSIVKLRMWEKFSRLGTEMLITKVGRYIVRHLNVASGCIAIFRLGTNHE